MGRAAPGCRVPSPDSLAIRRFQVATRKHGRVSPHNPTYWLPSRSAQSRSGAQLGSPGPNVGPVSDIRSSENTYLSQIVIDSSFAHLYHSTYLASFGKVAGSATEYGCQRDGCPIHPGLSACERDSVGEGPVRSDTGQSPQSSCNHPAFTRRSRQNGSGRRTCFLRVGWLLVSFAGGLPHVQSRIDDGAQRRHR